MQQVGDRQAHAITLGPGEIFAELLLILNEPYPVTGIALTAVRLYKHRTKDILGFALPLPNGNARHRAGGSSAITDALVGEPATGEADFSRYNGLRLVDVEAH